MDSPGAACSDADWSYLATAPSLSQLAGVLAGFVFTAVVLLLSRPLVARRQAQALGLFLAAFITLAMDSYLFAALTGDKEQVNVCLRSRSSGLIASGILGIGGMAIMAGICWLLAAGLQIDDQPQRTRQWKAADEERQELKDELGHLGRFAERILYAAGLAIACFVAVTGADYLYYGLGRPSPWILYGGAAVYVAVLCALLRWSFVRKRRQLGELKRATGQAVIYWTAGYGVVGAVLTTVIMMPFGDYWKDPDPVVVWTVAAFTLLGGLPVMVALAHAVPRSFAPDTASINRNKRRGYRGRKQ